MGLLGDGYRGFFTVSYIHTYLFDYNRTAADMMKTKNLKLVQPGWESAAVVGWLGWFLSVQFNISNTFHPEHISSIPTSHSSSSYLVMSNNTSLTRRKHTVNCI